MTKTPEPTVVELLLEWQRMERRAIRAELALNEKVIAADRFLILRVEASTTREAADKLHLRLAKALRGVGVVDPDD